MRAPTAGRGEGTRRLAAALLLLLAPALASAGGRTPDEAVAMLWRALSHEAGERPDVKTLRALFHPDAVVFGSRTRDGQPVFVRREATDFLAALDRVDPAGFFECEVHRELQAFDRFATAYSVVESRTVREAASANFTGVNSVQLHNDGEGWRVVALYYHVPTPERGLPAHPGRSGRCLD